MAKKIIILVIVAIVVFLFFYFNLGQYLNLETLKDNKEKLDNLYSNNSLLFIIGFFVIYVISTSISLPGATILTLTAGVIFGRWVGTGMVSFAAAIGATFAFLIARILLGETLQKKYKKQLKTFNAGIEKDGILYLLSLRLIPAFPFFIINLVMGLTKMPAWKYYIVSQIGMLPGTFVYVNAGTALANIQVLSDILSREVILSFVLLGILPLIIKLIMFLTQKLKRT